MAGEINPYACWLAGIEGVGNKSILALLTRAYGAEEVYEMPEGEIAEILGGTLKRKGLAGKIAAAIVSAQRKNPEECAAKLAEKGVASPDCRAGGCAACGASCLIERGVCDV